MPPQGYTPIEDYAAIGNLRTVALVSRYGSIDWCCLPLLDDPSVFAALLDTRRGGRFRVQPAEGTRGEQRYVRDTNVLNTRFVGGDSALHVRDFMPISGPITGLDVPSAPPEIHRLLRCGHIATEIIVEWSPRFDYGRARTRISRTDGLWIASAGEARCTLAGLPEEGIVEETAFGLVVRTRLWLEPGQARTLVMRWGTEDANADLARSRALLNETVRSWREWVEHCAEEENCAFAGRWQDRVSRSSLALKLLTQPDTGAIAAAATTSLPEEIGGVRNWDYRFAWIRDAALTGQALVSLGHRTEALDFLYFLQRATQASLAGGGRLQIMYGLHGETELTELELPHLEGYRESRPVRIGNAAALHRQLDVFGELMGAAYEFLRQGGKLPPDLWRFLTLIVDRAAEVWREPDRGIWEIRGGKRHFVHSKLLLWVALDRGISLAENARLPGNVKKWRRARHEIKAAILAYGFNERRSAFVQSFGSSALDAANLLIPIVGFLPFDDARVQSTIDRTLEELTDRGLVYRYLSDDGLPGGEGAFVLTTCWAVDALTLSGRLQQAGDLFRRVAAQANHVGLYAEEFDPESGRFLGNFPQAFSHIGFINSALYIARALGRKPRAPAPMGTREHRVETGHDPGAAV